MAKYCPPKPPSPRVYCDGLATDLLCPLPKGFVSNAFLNVLQSNQDIMQCIVDMIVTGNADTQQWQTVTSADGVVYDFDEGSYIYLAGATDSHNIPVPTDLTSGDSGIIRIQGNVLNPSTEANFAAWTIVGTPATFQAPNDLAFASFFPFLVDINSNVLLFVSNDIVPV